MKNILVHIRNHTWRVKKMPWGGGTIFFDKLKGGGGESLRGLSWLDFCIFEFCIKSIFEEMTKNAQNHF